MITTVHSAWLSYDDIKNDATFDIANFKDWYAIGGVDLSMVNDLTVATLLFLDPKTEQRYIYQMYWLPRDNFDERVERDGIPYDKWYEQGL